MVKRGSWGQNNRTIVERDLCTTQTSSKGSRGGRGSNRGRSRGRGRGQNPDRNELPPVSTIINDSSAVSVTSSNILSDVATLEPNFSTVATDDEYVTCPIAVVNTNNFMPWRLSPPPDYNNTPNAPVSYRDISPGVQIVEYGSSSEVNPHQFPMEHAISSTATTMTQESTAVDEFCPPAHEILALMGNMGIIDPTTQQLPQTSSFNINSQVMLPPPTALDSSNQSCFDSQSTQQYGSLSPVSKSSSLPPPPPYPYAEPFEIPSSSRSIRYCEESGGNSTSKQGLVVKSLSLDENVIKTSMGWKNDRFDQIAKRVNDRSEEFQKQHQFPLDNPEISLIPLQPSNLVSNLNSNETFSLENIVQNNFKNVVMDEGTIGMDSSWMSSDRTSTEHMTPGDEVAIFDSLQKDTQDLIIDGSDMVDEVLATLSQCGSFNDDVDDSRLDQDLNDSNLELTTGESASVTDLNVQKQSGNLIRKDNRTENLALVHNKADFNPQMIPSSNSQNNPESNDLLDINKYPSINNTVETTQDSLLNGGEMLSAHSGEKQGTKRKKKMPLPLEAKKLKAIKSSSSDGQSPHVPGNNKKWFYNNDHKLYLYGDGMFIANRQDLGVQGDIFLWRIIKSALPGKSCLRKFVPIVIDGRECHYGMDSFLFIEHFDDAFYIKYQPVIVKMIADTKEIQIGLHYTVDRSYPFLGFFPTTNHLYEPFKEYLFEMTKRALIGDQDRMEVSKISSEVSSEFPSEDSPTKIESYFQELIGAIMADPKWPPETLICIMSFPKLLMTRTGVDKSKGCKACINLGNKRVGCGAYKLAFSGPMYDPVTLRLDETKSSADIKQPDFQFCYGCPISLRSLHRMIHYKWWLYVCIRAQLIQLKAQLKSGQRYRASDLLSHFMGDFEWVDKMFYEYQTIAAEGFLAKEKSLKMSRSKSPVKSEPKKSGRPRSVSISKTLKNSKKSSISVSPSSIETEVECNKSMIVEDTNVGTE